MRILAIETATEACSVALFEDDEVLGSRHEVIGRGHAEQLVPMIAGLPGKGRADRIRVSLGPGSFTGVRIGLAVARALGIAWKAEVAGYPTPALLARMALQQRPSPDTERKGLVVCMNGGHGEWFVQSFDNAGRPRDCCRSLAPERAIRDRDEALVVGSRAEEFVALRAHGEALTLLPDASAAAALDPAQLVEELRPLYGREPDAKLPSQ